MGNFFQNIWHFELSPHRKYVNLFCFPVNNDANMTRCPFIEESAADIYAYKLPVFILLVIVIIVVIIIVIIVVIIAVIIVVSIVTNTYTTTKLSSSFYRLLSSSPPLEASASLFSPFIMVSKQHHPLLFVINNLTFVHDTTIPQS